MLVQECKASGMTDKEFCELRGESDKNIYYWKRKFREQVLNVASPKLVLLDPLPE